MINAGAGLAVDVVIDLLLIPDHGATGAAIGWAAAIGVINLLACLEVHFLMHLQIFDWATVRTAAAAAVCFGIPGLALGLAAPHRLWPVVVWLLVGGSAYLAWWWRRRDDDDVNLVLDALHIRRIGHSSGGQSVPGPS
jgi:O-antigen/teichoic acid export membrane protein